MQQLKALIIGIDSNIGSSLANNLQRTNWLVFGTSRRQTSKHIYLDLEKIKTIYTITGTFDVVYLCASVSDMLFCESNPDQAKNINVDAQIALIDYFLPKTARLIYLSSSAVFDGATPLATIDMACNPKSMYGYHKTLVEKYLFDLGDIVTIVRPTKVLFSTHKLLCNWKNTLLQGKVIEPFYDMSLCPVTMDVLIELLTTLALRKSRTIVHVSGKADISYAQFGESLANLLGVAANLVRSKSFTSAGINPKIVAQYSSLDMLNTIAEFKIYPPTALQVLQTVI